MNSRQASGERWLDARLLVAGAAHGTAIVLTAPLSYWGGFDSTTGLIIDQHHPQCGCSLAGCILVMPSGRGSSSSSSVLAEAIRRGTAPAAIVLRESDPIIALGALVAGELYGASCPVVVLDAIDYQRLHSGQQVQVRAATEPAYLLVSEDTRE